jgi:hypothetical protein
MGFLDNSSITVDAILTTRGREILSRGGNFDVTKFALSDEEIDYTMYDSTHPDGTNSFGVMIDNTSMLEAVPNKANFSSFLVNSSLEGSRILVGMEDYPRASSTVVHGTIPITIGTPDEEAEDYTFSVENTSIAKLYRVYEHSTAPWKKVLYNESVDSVVGRGLQWKPMPINTLATTTITVKGNVSGITKIITITPIPVIGSRVSPLNTNQVNVTDPNF